MIAVLTGNLAPPVLNAGMAIFFATPSISNKRVPALTLTPQWDILPLPLPILISAGFAVMGVVGNIRIHNLPFRLSFLTIACRAASICRDEIVPDLVAFSPTHPNFKIFERWLNFASLPFCIFLYFVFFGCNHIDFKKFIFT